jgi:hypothetical protein
MFARVQVSDFYPRIHFSTTLASIWLSTAHSVQMFSIRLSRVSGASISGKCLNQDIYHLQNFRLLMKSELICLLPQYFLLNTWPFSFKRLPPYPGIHHFSNGISDLSSITEKEQGTILCASQSFLGSANIDILQYIPPLMLGVCDADGLLISTLRALACVLTLARFHVHTSETLSLLKHHIWQFGQHAKVCPQPDILFYLDT